MKTMSNQITRVADLASVGVDSDQVAALILKMDAQLQACSNLVDELNVAPDALAGMDLDDVKRFKTALSKQITEANDARKEFKREWKKPQDAVEAAFKRAYEPIERLKAMYESEVRKREDAIRAGRFEVLSGFYEEFAPALVPVVPIERFIDPSKISVAKSWSSAKATNELAERVQGVAQQWEALKASNLEYAEEAEAVFFRTLSLQEALNHNAMRVEEAERIAQLKADVSPAEEEAEEVPTDAYREAQEAPQEAAEEPSEFVFAVMVTKTQKEALIAFMRANGIHGVVRHAS